MINLYFVWVCVIIYFLLNHDYDILNQSLPDYLNNSITFKKYQKTKKKLKKKISISKTSKIRLIVYLMKQMKKKN